MAKVPFPQTTTGTLVLGVVAGLIVWVVTHNIEAYLQRQHQSSVSGAVREGAGSSSTPPIERKEPSGHSDESTAQESTAFVFWMAIVCVAWCTGGYYLTAWLGRENSAITLASMFVLLITFCMLPMLLVDVGCPLVPACVLIWVGIPFGSFLFARSREAADSPEWEYLSFLGMATCMPLMLAVVVAIWFVPAALFYWLFPSWTDDQNIFATLGVLSALGLMFWALQNRYEWF